MRNFVRRSAELLLFVSSLMLLAPVVSVVKGQYSIVQQYIQGSSGEKLLWDSANVLALRNGANTQSFYIYNTYTSSTSYERAKLYWNSNVFTITTDKGSGGGSERAMVIDGRNSLQLGSSIGGVVQINAELQPTPNDTRAFGAAGVYWTHVYASRSIQGSKSKTFVDNTATAFVRLTVADDDYEGCGFVWTAYAEDAGTDARQTRTGRTHVAILNNSGTEACAFSTGDEAVLVTAGTFTCSFDCNSAAADTVDLRATCNTSLDAAAETVTFEYRLDCPSTIATFTPQ